MREVKSLQVLSCALGTSQEGVAAKFSRPSLKLKLLSSITAARSMDVNFNSVKQPSRQFTQPALRLPKRETVPHNLHQVATKGLLDSYRHEKGIATEQDRKQPPKRVVRPRNRPQQDKLTTDALREQNLELQIRYNKSAA